MTQAVTAQPGPQYTLSIASDSTIRKVLVWTYLLGLDPLRQAEVMNQSEPGSMSAQLHFQVEVKRQVFFVVEFVAAGGTGSIALFAVE